MDLAAINRKVDAVVRDKPAIAFDDAEGFDLRHENEGFYFAIMGSAILIEPFTISSRSAFTLAMTSG